MIEEIRLAKSYFPQVKEFFFDDDTFTDNLPFGDLSLNLGSRFRWLIRTVSWPCSQVRPV